MPKGAMPLIALFFANLIYAVNYGLAKDVMGEGYLQAFSFILFRVVGAVFPILDRFIFYQKREDREKRFCQICNMWIIWCCRKSIDVF